MYIYLFTFLSTVIFTHIVDKHYDKKDIIFYVCSLLTLLIPSFVAGCRSLTVGTDVKYYLVECFDLASNYSISELFFYSRWDFVFTLLVSIGFYFFNDINVSLGLIEFWIILFVFLALLKLRNKVQMWMGMFVYLFLFFNPSLNLMRQSMAVSVCLYVFSHFISKDLFKTLVFMIVSYFCHSTSIFFLLALLMFRYFFYNRKNNTLIITLYCISLPLLLIFYNQLLGLLISMGLMSNHFEAYQNSHESYFSLTNALYPVVIFFIVYFIGKNKKTLDDTIWKFTLIILYSVFILNCLSVVSLWAFRISMYFTVLLVFCLPVIQQMMSLRFRNIYLLVLISFLFVYWFYDVVINGSNETYPYKSIILGF